MTVLALLTLVLLGGSLWAFAYTGVRQYLAVWIYGLPLYGIAFFPSSQPVNGLLVTLCLLFSALHGYAWWGYGLWCLEKRKVPKLYTVFSGVILYPGAAYLCYEGLTGGSLAFLGIRLSAYPANILSLALGILLTIELYWVWIRATEKFFSQPGQFVLIQCRSKRKKAPLYLGDLVGIGGVQNGKKYLFSAKWKAYLLLRGERSLVLEGSQGIFGGFYAVRNSHKEPGERKRRSVAKKVRKHCLITLCAAALVLLFLVRIGYGVPFEEILAVIERGVLR